VRSTFPVGRGCGGERLVVVGLAYFEESASPVGADGRSKRLVVGRRVTNGVGGAELGRRPSRGLDDPHSGVAVAFDSTDPVGDVHGTNTGGVGGRGSVLVRDDVVGFVTLAYGERAADPVGLHADGAAGDVFALDRSIVFVLAAGTSAECSAGTVLVRSAFVDNELIRSASIAQIAHPVSK